MALAERPAPDLSMNSSVSSLLFMIVTGVALDRCLSSAIRNELVV